MKASSPPVLTLATFPQAATPYYAERLRAHGTRLPHLATLAHFTDMPERGEVCTVPLEPEPGL